jgi:hypothetical protein
VALKYTSLARGCSDGKVRNAFYQHDLPWWFELTSILFGTITMFRDTAHNTVHTNHKPQLTTPSSNIHRWQGDATMERWEISFTSCLTLVYYSPISQSILTTRPTQPCHSQKLSLKEYETKFEGELLLERHFVFIFHLQPVFCTHPEFNCQFNDTNTPNNKPQRNNQSSDQLLEDQRRKKVRNVMLQMLLSFNLLVNLLSSYTWTIRNKQ